ncbi:hypothetical protein L837_4242 [Mycobacterium avium MAV_061107_1842]|nr:hypothetical protein L837_4242 [Mycobacterium avium MAV_061107_1842]
MHAVALPQACDRAKWIGRLTTADATSAPAPHLRPGGARAPAVIEQLAGQGLISQPRDKAL